MSAVPPTTTPGGGATGGSTGNTGDTSNTEDGGRSGRNRRGNNRRGNRGNGNNSNSDGRIKTLDFKGSESGMNGHVFDCTSPTDSKRYDETITELITFVGANYTSGKDLTKCIQKLEMVAIPTIQDANSKLSKAEVEKLPYAEQMTLKHKSERYNKRCDALEDNVEKLYYLVVGQCTPHMDAEVKAHKKYEDVHNSQNGIGLLKIVKSIAYDFQSTKYRPNALLASTSRLYKLTLSQCKNLTDYYETFQGMVDVLATQGSSIGMDYVTCKDIIDTGGLDADGLSHAEYRDTIGKEAQQRYLACVFLQGTAPKYQQLLADLENQHYTGKDVYPKTVLAAYTRVKNWTNPNSSTSSRAPDTAHLYLNQGGDPCGKCGTEGCRPWHKTCPQYDPTKSRRGRQESTNLNATASTSGGSTGGPPSTIATQESGPPAGAAATMLTAGVSEGHVNEDDDAALQEFFFNFLQTGTGTGITLKNSESNIPSNWILLDNQSTIDIFHNKAFLKNIRPAARDIIVHTNAGTTRTKLVGDLPGYGVVYYEPKGIANILSLARVKDRFQVTFDSSSGNTFVVTKPDGSRKLFQQSQSGLYFFSARLPSHGHTFVDVVETVAGNKSKYSNEDYSRALKVRQLQQAVGRPSTQDLITILDSNLIKGCSLTARDVKNAEHIFGPDLGILKGKTVRRSSPVVTPNVIPAPSFLRAYADVTLAIDVMRVNGIPFLITVSRHLKFGSVHHLTNQSKDTLVAAIKHSTAIYKLRGLRVKIIKADGQFKPLEPDINHMEMFLNCVSEDEHVPEIERYIRTTKERMRCVVTTLPFKRLPPRMVVELAHYAVFWLNVLPPKDGLSKTLSPRALVTSMDIDYKTHCRLPFGSYVQTHESHDNSMTRRTTGAIALRPSGNHQGGYHFFSLTTGRVITRHHFTPLPMPQDVIDRLDRLGRKARAPIGLVFKDRYATDDDDSTYVPEVDASDDDSLPPGDDDDDWTPVGRSTAGVRSRSPAEDPPTATQNQNRYQALADDDDEDDTNDDDIDTENDFPDSDNDTSDSDLDPAMGPEENENQDNIISDKEWDTRSDPHHDEGHIDHDIDDYNDTDTTTDDPRSDIYDPRSEADTNDPRSDAAEVDVGVENEEVPENTNESVPIDTISDEPPVQQELHKLAHRDGTIAPILTGRTRSETALTNIVTPDNIVDMLKKQRKPGIIHPNNMVNEHQLAFPDLHEAVHTQYTMKKGLKVFGEPGKQAVKTEMQQVHDRGVIVPVHGKHLTREEKLAALRYLMFLKRKRCGRIKGRGCADGRQQRPNTPKEDTTAPTVAIESLFGTATIDAKERRDVATADIAGAFMQADQDELVRVRFAGELAEALALIDPKLYRKHIVFEKGEPVLYAELAKALYGTLKAALLFWRKLSSFLVNAGFIINPYDWCVANKMINGKQCTIVWHVDDLKISHVDSAVVSDVLELLNSEFGKEAPLTVTRGKVHDYLGMTLDYSTPGKVKIRMEKYIQNILDELPDTFTGTANTPATSDLFTVDPDSPALDEADSRFYHRLVAKLLFLSKRSRPDILTAQSYLCTRVKNPNKDDMRKLRRVIQYLRQTPELSLTLEADDLSIIKWWIDGSFAVHPDMKSHTGGTMSLGRGSGYSGSTGQKLNTRSSTETELVAVDDFMPQILWTRYFFEAQGYTNQDTIIFQDNKSAILLEKNGRASSSKRTRHINIRYYFIHDRIQAGEVRAEYCPTKEMVADFFTKPLQGQQFYKLRSFIMNIPDSADDVAPTESQE